MQSILVPTHDISLARYTNGGHRNAGPTNLLIFQSLPVCDQTPSKVVALHSQSISSLTTGEYRHTDHRNWFDLHVYYSPPHPYHYYAIRQKDSRQICNIYSPFL